MKYILAFLGVLFLAACGDVDNSTRVVGGAGGQEVVITDVNVVANDQGQNNSNDVNDSSDNSVTDDNSADGSDNSVTTP